MSMISVAILDPISACSIIHCHSPTLYKGACGVHGPRQDLDRIEIDTRLPCHLLPNTVVPYRFVISRELGSHEQI